MASEWIWRTSRLAFYKKWTKKVEIWGFWTLKERFEMRPGFSSFKTDFFGMGGLIITVHIDFDPGFRKNFIDPTLLYTAQSRKMIFKPQLLLKFKIISLEWHRTLMTSLFKWNSFLNILPQVFVFYFELRQAPWCLGVERVGPTKNCFTPKPNVRLVEPQPKSSPSVNEVLRIPK